MDLVRIGHDQRGKPQKPKGKNKEERESTRNRSDENNMTPKKNQKNVRKLEKKNVREELKHPT